MLQDFISIIVSTFSIVDFILLMKSEVQCQGMLVLTLEERVAVKLKKELRIATLSTGRKKTDLLLYKQPYFHSLHVYINRKGLRSYSLNLK